YDYRTLRESRFPYIPRIVRMYSKVIETDNITLEVLENAETSVISTLNAIPNYIIEKHNKSDARDFKQIFCRLSHNYKSPKPKSEDRRLISKRFEDVGYNIWYLLPQTPPTVTRVDIDCSDVPSIRIENGFWSIRNVDDPDALFTFQVDIPSHGKIELGFYLRNEYLHRLNYNKPRLEEE